jgi:hypothetical protein
MKICIKKTLDFLAITIKKPGGFLDYARSLLNAWLNQRPKIKQWLWFIVLWFGGLSTVTILTYPIKMLMKNFR